ncbi:MAG: TetR/AcrR family transcriptional regulator [Gammaproteobacteria bacterium]|nr:TetR/AcrR family transcriptional regulator [Gammaproteobacteria bacterium]
MSKTSKRQTGKKPDADILSGADKRPDGRLLRTERSRQLIIDALHDLINEGVLQPTAQTVAERAGVGIRTVFRHFADMETLFATMDVQLRESYEGLFLGGNRAGTLDERILHAIERRAAAFEKQSPLMRSTRAQIWRSPVLQKNYARNQRGLRKDLADWLPEIADLPPVRRELVDAAASFETWDRLRSHQGLGVKASMEVVHEILRLAFGIN